MTNLAEVLTQMGITGRASTGGEGSIVMELPGEVDLKLRKGGEITFRVHRDGGNFSPREFSLTVQSPDAAPAWQNAHHHKGIEERYLVLNGSILIAYVNVIGRYQVEELLRNMSFTVSPGLDHNVFVSPGTVFLVKKFRRNTSSNPNRAGNDWWPASDDFVRWIKTST